MTDATKQGRPAGVLPFPPAANRDTLTVAQLADLYVRIARVGCHSRQFRTASTRRASVVLADQE